MLTTLLGDLAPLLFELPVPGLLQLLLPNSIGLYFLGLLQE
jgi:hypothetical protein